MNMTFKLTLADLRAKAAAHGLECLGVVGLGEEPSFAAFQSWLAANRHAGMDYLRQYQELRADPRRLLAGARSAVILALPYYQGDRQQDWQHPRVAQYARLKDYHRLFWQKGERLLAEMASLGGPSADGGGEPFAGRVVTDSAPILERALAARAGDGFIGKNTCFIQPKHGSFFLLGEVVTNLPLARFGGDFASPPAVDPTKRSAAGGCGSCRRCQVHCPTGALGEDYVLDANLCLAYWTIEHRGTIPERFWPWLRYYLFGCDRCQLVCPYNRAAVRPPLDGLLKIAAEPDLLAMATMTQATYEQWFGGTPMTRAKRGGLMRNALIAMTVTNDARLPEACSRLMGSEGVDPVVHATLVQIEAYRRGGSS